MIRVISVKFRDGGKSYFFDPGELEIKEGDGVIIQPPVYLPFMSQVSGNNREIIENPLVYSDGRYTVDFEDLEKKCKAPNAKLLILCNPHNPVGRVWSRDELKRMGEIAKENGVIVLSDEIHGELILPGIATLRLPPSREWQTTA